MSPPPSRLPRPAADPTPAAAQVLAVGASAGGLSAFRAFVAGLPAQGPWCVVVAQHLQDDRASMLAALLQASTPWPVKQAVDGEPLTAGSVRVVPPGQVATFEGLRLRLHLRRPDEPAGVIDSLFVSAAAVFGPRAVAVVLSGMGHDGAEGLRAVRAAGGLAAVQSTDDAEHADMPRHAQALGGADVVAPARQLADLIAQALSSRAGQPAVGASPGGTEPAVPDESRDAGAEALGRILQQLRAQGGQGFERYKPTTVRRRVERRMGLHGLRDLADYADLLESNAGEVDLLFKEMMIGVTCFFRDPELWQILGRQVLPQLADKLPADAAVRAWCAGCSTGQEAYSLAMTWSDVLSARGVPRRLQVFASDLSAGAVARARAGSYKAPDLEGVSAAQRERYFVAEGGRARVTRELREMVLFARHDLTADPPFGRLDLLICRNVLIYFQSDQQHELLRMFHQCLRPGGWLVLGLSETLGPAADLFQPVEGMPQIFRRRESALPRLVPRLVRTVPVRSASWDAAPMTEPVPRPSNLIREVETLVLQRFAPAAILVSRDGDVLWTGGPKERYLDLADGRSNINVLVQARASLRTWLSGALSEALSAGSKGMELRGLRLGEAGAERFVDVSVLPFETTASDKALGLIVIRETGREHPLGDDVHQGIVAADASPEVLALAKTVRRLKEELQASSEDFQSANEELQSSNEELTTSREEMQSMNEELQAINAELQAKLDALALEQSDMKNLLDSTQIATLFLDEQLNVRRFTEQARQLVNLRDGDAGRPLSDLTTRLCNASLVERAAETLRTLRPSEEAVSGPDGRWFSVRVLPYRTVANVIAGVVITFTDTTRSDASQRGEPPPA